MLFVRKNSRKRVILVFGSLLVLIVAAFITSRVRTEIYNRTRHQTLFSGPELFGEEVIKLYPVSVNAVLRGSTWTKAFDLRIC